MVIDLSSRRELFVDCFLISELKGLSLQLHTPTLRPSNVTGAYATVIKDGDLYRRYYRRYCGSDGKPFYDGNPFEVTCYAESTNGIDWIEPELGIVDVNGSRDNNVILQLPPYSHNFAPFLDRRPGVPEGERFKALAGTHKDDRSRPQHAIPFPEEESGLCPFVSADGIHWRKMSDKPVIISEQFAFDSQNVSFWSEKEQKYLCYFRTWMDNPAYSLEEIQNAPYKDFVKYHLRSISRTTSDDYLHWTEPEALDPNVPGEHLYTSQTHPYFRAPHIYIATPTRLMPELGYATDIMFMTTRDGKKFDRTFMEAFIRPGPERKFWTNRSNYVAQHIVPLSETEMGLYMDKNRLYILRTDGFASLQAKSTSGEMVSKPFIFSGGSLKVNFSTSVAGYIKIGLVNSDGSAIPGFTLDDCCDIIGDEINRTVAWERGCDLTSIAGREIRMRVAMRDADLFSFEFGA